MGYYNLIPALFVEEMVALKPMLGAGNAEGMLHFLIIPPVQI
jgi:hypothetical protein